jgi:hypothetical protein
LAVLLGAFSAHRELLEKVALLALRDTLGEVLLLISISCRRDSTGGEFGSGKSRREGDVGDSVLGDGWS